MPSPLPCPHCTNNDGASVLLVPDHGLLQESVCPSCHGRFLTREQVEDLVVDKMGVAVSLLRQLTDLYPGHSLTCPACTGAMNLLLLRGIYLDLCLFCGGLWFDEGELSQFTLGLVEEVNLEEHRIMPQDAAPSLQWLDAIKKTAGAALQEILAILKSEQPHMHEVKPLDADPSQRQMQKGHHGLYLHKHEIAEHQIETALSDFYNYTNYDFSFLANNHHGVLLDEIKQDDLKLVQTRLKKENIDSSIFMGQDMALPLAKKLSGGQIREDGIEFKDAFSRSFVVTWDRFLVLSISDILRIHQKDYNKDFIVHSGPSNIGRRIAIVDPVHERKDERATHQVFRLFEYITIEGQRGHLEAHREYAESDTAALRGHDTSGGDETFIELAQASMEAKQASPHLLVNPGVKRRAENSTDNVPLFRSRRFYERSLRWLLWKAKQSTGDTA
jgi:Zn-finger nucleic acid-binding protein